MGSPQGSDVVLTDPSFLYWLYSSYGRLYRIRIQQGLATSKLYILYNRPYDCITTKGDKRLDWVAETLSTQHLHSGMPIS